MKKLSLLILVFSLNAFAQEFTNDDQKLESSISGFLNGDSYEGRGGGFDLDLALDNKHRLLFGASGNRSEKNQSKEDRVRDVYIGLGSSPLKRHYMNLTFEFSGIRNQFETRSINPTFNLRSENRRATLYFTPGFRRTKIFTDPLFTTRENYTVSNPYLTLGLSFIGPRKWTLKVEGSRNWYNADLDALKDYESSYIFSPTTLSMTDSFQKSRITLGIGHIFRYFQMSIEGTRSVSEVDDIISRTLALKSTFFVQDNLDAGFVVGGTKTSEQVNGDSKNRFLELNMAYYW